MPSFPTITGGSIAKYPLTRTRLRRNVVNIFTDFSEQRFAQGSPLDAFDLVFTRVKTSDKEAIRAFWDSRQGSFDTGFDMTLNDPPGSSTTYHHMQFTPGQQFEPTEQQPGLWTFTLKMRKTRKD